MNKYISEKRPHLIPAIIAALMLLGALAPWPYGYYQLLRFVTCGVAVYIVYTAYNWQRIWAVWLFGFIALLFNPLIPIHLSREIWQPIDVICALLFFLIGFMFKEPSDVEETGKGLQEQDRLEATRLDGEIDKLKEHRKKIGRSRDQHYAFVQVLRDLFFDMPDKIIAILKDERRNDSLLDLWDKVGEEVGKAGLVPAGGLSAEIKMLDNNTVVGLITLPTPQLMCEAYFVALVYCPEESSEQKPLTRFIVLEHTIDLNDGSPPNVLCQWEGGDEHVNMGYSCEPTLEDFSEAVCSILMINDLRYKHT